MIAQEESLDSWADWRWGAAESVPQEDHQGETELRLAPILAPRKIQPKPAKLPVGWVAAERFLLGCWIFSPLVSGVGSNSCHSAWMHLGLCKLYHRFVKLANSCYLLVSFICLLAKIQNTSYVVAKKLFTVWWNSFLQFGNNKKQDDDMKSSMDHKMTSAFFTMWGTQKGFGIDAKMHIEQTTFLHLDMYGRLCFAIVLYPDRSLSSVESLFFIAARMAKGS